MHLQINIQGPLILQRQEEIPGQAGEDKQTKPTVLEIAIITPDCGSFKLRKSSQSRLVKL